MQHLTQRWAGLQVQANQSRSYAQQLASLGGGMASLLVKHGKVFRATPLPEGVEQGRMGACFENAMQVALYGGDGYDYCEGYAVAPGLFPMHHGWVTVDGRTAIDPTWPEGTHYFGIQFDTGFVRKRILQRGYWGMFAIDIPDDVEIGWYEKGLPAGAVVR